MRNPHQRSRSTPQGKPPYPPEFPGTPLCRMESFLFFPSSKLLGKPYRLSNIVRLRALVTTGEKHYQLRSKSCEVNAIAGAISEPHLRNARANALTSPAFPSCRRSMRAWMWTRAIRSRRLRSHFANTSVLPDLHHTEV